MSGSLFGYYELGLRALSAAQFGLQVAGDNISNVNTPGYSRRRVELSPGMSVQVKGGFVDRGVQVTGIRRLSDRFLQTNLEREKGSLAGSQELLRGLYDLESLFGTLEGDGIPSLYAAFADRFAELAGQPEDPTMRRVAIGSADTLARQIRDTYQRIQVQRRAENDSIGDKVEEINELAESLATLNREIHAAEVERGTASPLRDKRDQIVERLAELTGGSVVRGESEKLLFSFPGGPTLVTGENAVPLQTSRNIDGMIQISSSGLDLTSRLRQGELGAQLELRDDHLTARMSDLDALASDLITRANALTSGATDLDGNPAGPLFEPNPPVGAGVALSIGVTSDLLNDSRRLGLSTSGAPGDGTVALEISKLYDTASAALGNRSPASFVTDMLTGLGNKITQTDVTTSVAQGLLENLEARRDSISGISLDEEAVELMRFQRSYEAAARFMQVLNEVTEITLSIGGR